MLENVEDEDSSSSEVRSTGSLEKNKKAAVKSKFKLNYKHHIPSNCSIGCFKKFLNSEFRKCHKPYPICYNIGNGPVVDSLISLVQKKQDYNLKITSIRNMYRQFQKRLQVAKQFQCYKDLQDVISQDPDKYFNSIYNWYYTGGNLVIEKLEDTELIFYTNNSELNVAKLRKENSVWEAKNKRVLSNHSSEIYQLEFVTNNSKKFLGVRQKNDILLYDMKIDSNEEVVCELANIQNTDIPFVGMSLNKQNHEEYTTINAKQVLQNWDLFTLKPLYEYEVPHDIDELEEDCFAQISYYDNNVLSYINRTKFCLFDKRSNCFSSKYEVDCSEIIQFNDRFVSICPIQNNPSLCYITTFREILLFDLRFKNVINKYSHSFNFPPYVSDFISLDDNNNIICTSSSKSDEKLILEQRDGAYCLPLTLPTIKDSFEYSLLMNPNMTMSLHIRDRLDVSTTGIQLWKSNDETITVFSLNTLGDIYCYDTKKGNSLDSNEGINNFAKWNKKILDSGTIINQLDFVDKVVLNDVKFNFNTEPEDLNSLIKNKRLQDCVQNLKKQVKGYSSKICDLWYDVAETNVLDDMEEVPPDVSVRNWLSHYCMDKEDNNN